MKTEPTTDALSVPLHRLVRRCRVEMWTGRMTQWRLVHEYASRRNAKRAIPRLKEKLGTHELRWMDSPNADVSNSHPDKTLTGTQWGQVAPAKSANINPKSKNMNTTTSPTELPAASGSARLAAWHLRQCDGGWEHSYGVKIETYDNPGWGAKIDIEESKSESLTGKGKVNGMTWEVVEQQGLRQLWGYCEETCDLEGMLSMLVDVLESAEQNASTLAHEPEDGHR